MGLKECDFEINFLNKSAFDDVNLIVFYFDCAFVKGFKFTQNLTSVYYRTLSSICNKIIFLVIAISNTAAFNG